VQSTLLSTFNDDFHNEVLHLLASHELNNSHEVFLGSDLSYYQAESKNAQKGYELYVGYKYRKDDFRMSSNVTSRSKNIRSEMGRMFDTGFTSGNLNLNYSPNFFGKYLLEEAGISVWGDYSIKTESYDFYSTNIGTNLWFNLIFDLNYWFNVGSGKLLYERDIYDFKQEFAWNDFSTGLSYDKFSNLGFSASFSQKQSLYYSRFKSYQKRNFGLNIWGNYGARLNYGVDINQIEYLDFAPIYQAEIINDSGEVIVVEDFSDNRYCLGNAYISLNLSNTFSIKHGLGFNNYELAGRTGHLGFYANIKWEFRQDYFIYAGYSTAVDEMEEQGFWDKSRILNHEQLYMKVVITI
jgi:hypothetical protein